MTRLNTTRGRTAAGVAGVALALAAWGAADAAKRAKPSPSPATPAEVKLVDGALMTKAGAPLYLFKHDTMVGMSHCEGDCAKAWPPLLAPEAAKAPKDWSKVPRMDGAYQWAVQDHPLYTTTRTGAALTEATGTRRLVGSGESGAR